MRLTLLIVSIMVFTNNSITRAESPTSGQQVEQSLKVSDDESVPYLLYLPKDYDLSEKSWPLMLFLHGRGESRGPLSLVTKWGPPRMLARGDHLPYIVVSPQCPVEDRWEEDGPQANLAQLLDHVTENYRVDEDRVYLTGLSLGGHGSWRLASEHPERFAAVAPICGRGNPDHAPQLKQLPIWAFHGDQDTAVPVSTSIEMAEAIRKAGGEKIRLTILEHVGHNSWSAAYATPELYKWFEEHHRGKATQ